MSSAQKRCGILVACCVIITATLLLQDSSEDVPLVWEEPTRARKTSAPPPVTTAGDAVDIIESVSAAPESDAVSMTNEHTSSSPPPETTAAVIAAEPTKKVWEWARYVPPQDAIVNYYVTSDVAQQNYSAFTSAEEASASSSPLRRVFTGYWNTGHLRAPFPEISYEDLIYNPNKPHKPRYKGEVFPEEQSADAQVAICELALSYVDCCKPREETVACVERVGDYALRKILSTHCTTTSWYRQLVRTIKSRKQNGDKTNWDATPTEVQRGRFEAAQSMPFSLLRSVLEPRVEPTKWPADAFGPPRVCQDGTKHYPISFAIPMTSMAPSVSRTKIFEFLPYIPGRIHYHDHVGYSLSVNDEWLSHTLYRHSLYAFSHKRGGWDCMRHYEILAAGGVPYFPDLPICPNNTLTNLPKALILQAMRIPGLEHLGMVKAPKQKLSNEYMIHERLGRAVNFRKPGDISRFAAGWAPLMNSKPDPRFDDIANTSRLAKGNGSSPAQRKFFDTTEYMHLAQKIFEHTKKYLSTRSLAAYILRTLNRTDAQRVLLIGRHDYDYLHQSVEHGMGDLRLNTTVFGHAGDWVLKLGREWLNSPAAEVSRRERDRRNAEEAAVRTIEPPLEGIGAEDFEAARPKRIQSFLNDDKKQRSKEGGPRVVAGSAWNFGFRSDPRYVRLLNISLSDDTEMVQRIAGGEFDVIIYTYMFDGVPLDVMPWWNSVVKASTRKTRRSTLAFIHHDDDAVPDPQPVMDRAARYGTVFRREMHDVACGKKPL